jgi:hypothetical protein
MSFYDPEGYSSGLDRQHPATTRSPDDILMIFAYKSIKLVSSTQAKSYVSIIIRDE